MKTNKFYIFQSKENIYRHANLEKEKKKLFVNDAIAK